MASLYEFSVKDIKGTTRTMSEFAGKVLLVVNTASRCGFTPQYAGLEKMYKRFHDQGFSILGFPCDQFGNQEPGSDSAIKEFCSINYGVSFPMFAKIDVNGRNAHPLFVYLKNNAPGMFGTRSIKWNFTKFLIDRGGKVVHRYAPTKAPEELLHDIEKILASNYSP